MVPLPPLNDEGDLPPGVHAASMGEVLARFGGGGFQRRVVALRVVRIHRLAMSTGQVHRFLLFGSFVTSKVAPNDVDVFLLMKDTFDLGRVSGEVRVIWDHAGAQSHFGASVFWLRRLSAFPEEEAVANWGIRRDGMRRGIVEIVPE